MVFDYVSVVVPSWSFDYLYTMFKDMSMACLKNEYFAAMRCLDNFYGVSSDLVDSGLREYIDSWVDIMRIVIAERVFFD